MFLCFTDFCAKVISCHRVLDISVLTKLPVIITDHMILFLFIASYCYNQGKVPWMTSSVLLLERRIGEVKLCQ